MNISEGLKRIINVIYYPWLFLGISWLLWALFSFGLKFEKTFLIIIGIVLPVVLKYSLFYIIDGFKTKD